MLAMFYFMALYMQNILGYSPIQAGALYLPSTMVQIVLGPIAGRLTDRIGPRLPITVGLVVVAVALFWQSFVGVDTGYGFLLPAFVLMGLGIGLVMSPMSTAAMNAVHPTKAGVASGVLSMSRMVGATFGVAVLGALVAALGRSKIDELLPALPAGRRAALADSLGSGGVQVGGAVGDAVREAYVTALGTGLRVGAATTLLAAILAWRLVARQSVAASAAEARAAAGTPAAEPARAELESKPVVA
jgi:MFS family permease